MVDMTFAEIRNAEKLRQAARLIEDVAYARAGIHSKEKVAHLMLIAASLERVAGITPVLGDVANDC